MPGYNLSYPDIGGALSNYGNLMAEGYRNAQELGQRQQQLNALYPSKVYVAPPLVGTVGGGPAINQFTQASRAGAQNRINEANAIPSRSVMDPRTGKLVPVPPQVLAPPQYGPSGMVQPDDTDRAPAGGDPGRALLDELKQKFMDGTIAKHMGLKTDENGGVYAESGNGASATKQADDYNKIYLAIMGGQSGILTGAERPQYPPPVQFLPPPDKGKGKGGAAKDTTMADAERFAKQHKVDALASLTDPKEKEKAQAAKAIYDVWVTRGAKPTDMMDRFNSRYTPSFLNAPGQSVNSAPAPGTSKLTEQQIRGDVNFPGLVNQYMSKHGVTKGQAEQAIIIFKQSR